MFLFKIIIKKTLWNIYDHLGKLALINLLWCLSVFLIIPSLPVTGGIFFIANKIASYEPATLKDFFYGIKKYFWRSIAIGLFTIIIISLFILNILFYSRLSDLFGASSVLEIIGAFLSGTIVWLIVFVITLYFYTFPIMVKYDYGIAKSIKKGLSLIFIQPFYSFLLFISTMLFTIIMLFTGVGIPFAIMSFSSVFICTAEREIERYSLAKLSNSEINKDDIMNEEKREFRDLFRPWETKQKN